MSLVEQRLVTILSRNWWVLLVRGLIAITFGVLTWLRPGISLAALVLVFGAYALTDGVLAVWAAVAGRKEQEHWVVLLLGGLIGVGVGLLTFLAPGVTAIAILFYIAVWAIAKGVLEIAAAIRLRKEIDNEWLLGLGGAASVLFGLLLMSRPGEGALAVLWLIALYAVLFGALLVMLSFRVRGLHNRPVAV
ncbi:MAG TPA: HdeD family acid-resistance protein [Candidatus Polarisedimenticolia bacterium]|nr:HdeD family acid-resistance protein [Candidatus Polarisedimenticolia bacterium]